MKTRVKLSLTVLDLLLMSFVLHYGLLLLNIANDFAVLGGAVVLLILFIGGPWLLMRIWRSKKNASSPTDVS